jgi:hypothetical protein
MTVQKMQIGSLLEIKLRRVEMLGYTMLHRQVAPYWKRSLDGAQPRTFGAARVTQCFINRQYCSELLLSLVWGQIVLRAHDLWPGLSPALQEVSSTQLRRAELYKPSWHLTIQTTPCGGGLEYFHHSPCES